MNDWAVSFLLPLILAFVGASTGIYSLVLQRKKLSAEASEVITRASKGLIEQYERRMKTMEGEHEVLISRVATLSVEVDQLRTLLREKDNEIVCRDEYIEQLLRGIHRLIAQLHSENRVPAWEPPDRKEMDSCDT
jgi:hypothetical protein